MSEVQKHNSEHSQLMETVYQELRQYANYLISREYEGVTFQATELANETYLKLFNAKNMDWSNPQEFMAAAVVVMRRYLVDHARKKTAAKRIPNSLKDELTDQEILPEDLDDHIINLDEALRALEDLDPHQAKIVELRFFAGFSEAEIARIFDVSRRTISREWKIAKMWLECEMKNNE